MSSEARTPRLADFGKKRMFPTEPLRRALTIVAQRGVSSWEPRETDDYYGWSGQKRSVDRGLLSFCEQRGINPRYLYKPALGEFVLDRICCKAGLHPSEVYEDWHSLADRFEVA